MATSAASINILLGLDAADYTRALTKAETDAYNFGHSIGTTIRAGAAAGTAALTALGVTAVATFSKMADQISNYQGIADKIGDDAAAVQSLKLAADISETSLDKIASASVKLTAELSKTTDQSKGAGAALKALGLNLNDFKALAPVDQLKAAAQALAGFKDDAGKTAVQTALLGKSSAELSGFLKDLAEVGETNIRLTNEQIGAIDEHKKAQARLKSEVESVLQLFAVQSIDALTAFTGTVKIAINDVLGLSNQSSDLANNRGVQVFAENVGRALADAIDYVKQSVNEFKVLVDFVSSSAAALQKVAKFDFEGAAQVGKDFRDRYGLDEYGRKIAGAGQAAGKSYVDQFNEQLAGLARSRFAANDPRRLDLNKPSLSGFNPKAPPKGPNVKNTAAAEAKAQLGLDIEEIKAALDAQVDAYRNAEKILSAERAAGLTDESTYYRERIRLTQETTAAQEDAARQTIARLEAEKLSGKDAIDNARKIAVEQAKLAKIQADGTTTVRVLGIEQEAAYRRSESAILAARQAAEDFFQTTNRGYARQLAGIGQGDKFREYLAGLQSVEEQYQQRRQQYANQRQQAEQSGTFTEQARKDYDRLLAITDEYQAKAVDSYKRTYEAIQQAQKSWLVGASEALANYADEAANVAKHTQETVSNALKGLEDQLVNVFTGKKFDTKALIESITADLARATVKEKITGPLAGFLKDAIGLDIGGATGLGGNAALAGSSTAAATALTALTTATTAAATALASLSASSTLSSIGGSGDGLGDLISVLGLSGARAGGGPVMAGGLYRVNERGPELLDVNGKQFLMMGRNAGMVTPNDRIGSAHGNMRPLVQNFHFEAPTERRTQQQIGAAAWRGSRMAAARLS